MLALVANLCMQQRIACALSRLFAIQSCMQRQASMLDGCAGAQALTRKLSEAALGLGGKQHHAIIPPVEDSPLAHEEAHNMTLPEASTLSGGRSSVLRPQVSLGPCRKLRALPRSNSRPPCSYSTASIPNMGMHLIFNGKRHFCAASPILEALPQA